MLSGIGKKKAQLIHIDGDVYEGISFGADVAVSGECVFQTGMVGYVESLTDPSYCGQILVLSYPLIGNYGVPDDRLISDEGLSQFMESNKIHVSGLVVAEYTGDDSFSHWNAVESLGSWLKRHNIPGISGVDTRSIIKKLREVGSIAAKIVPFCVQKSQIPDFLDTDRENLVPLVSVSEPKLLKSPNPVNSECTVLFMDFGAKANQIRCFLKRGIHVKIVPWNYPIISEPRESYQGLFLSNGPGNPELLEFTISQVSQLLERESKFDDPKVIFGICLGNQILAKAAGAKIYKLKYGNRGHNQPCIDTRTGRCHLTMQNHGFVVDSSTLKPDWKTLFVNANDGTNEGIYHEKNPWSSVQFHPEAKGGPNETEYLFEKFISIMRKVPFFHHLDQKHSCDILIHASKVLLLGSGGLSIGQAGEFDYSGSQAIKAMKSEGISTILINPNIATVQTSQGLADKIYFVPLNSDFVTKIIEQERPDGILLQFGGQTALNCGIELYKNGVLEKYGVKVLGTSMETIIATEDREIFAEKLNEIQESIAPSIVARNLDQALKAADVIGFPVIVRAGFALGGLGSGFASNIEELRALAKSTFAKCEQILIEKSLKGWKEIEYEVVRDYYDNSVTVCNMENFDPLGIHTGESIVVAPSQTLSDSDYHLLRKVAIKVVRHLQIIGECNIQFAFDPKSQVYYIIEVNARLSRSSALASKATGYPLAYIAGKLALGNSLPTLRNNVTQSTTACYEPSLDYVVVKMPKWDCNKFAKVSSKISTSMKSVGEVMALGRGFEEAFQKAIRMVHPGRIHGFETGKLSYTKYLSNKMINENISENLCGEKLKSSINDSISREAKLKIIKYNLENPSDERIFAIADAFAEGYSVEQVFELTKIDRWFLRKLHLIYTVDSELKQITTPIDRERLRLVKKMGFSDKQLSISLNTTEVAIRQLRKELGVIPCVKKIDTVAAEFPIREDVNYMYLTYNGTEDDCESEELEKNEESCFKTVGPTVHAPNTCRNVAKMQPNKKSIIVLGSGSYSIGSSVEFDWCAVSCIHQAKKMNFRTIMINCNPETVSTDYDECDALYFEELTVERVLDIWDKESPAGVIVSMGGQIPNNIALSLSRSGVNILGTSAEMIETAENRYKFSRMLDSIGVDQPKWKECRNLEEIGNFCSSFSFPCLVRPSFVLSGAGMCVVHTSNELIDYLESSNALAKKDSPVVISNFITKAKEIDVDAVAYNGEVIVYAICEHVENAGIHSGDATLVLPPQDLDSVTIEKLVDAIKKIGRVLNVTGPFNTQFIAKDDQIKVIETNLRASRSLPFVSKTLSINFVEIATKCILTGSIDNISTSGLSNNIILGSINPNNESDVIGSNIKTSLSSINSNVSNTSCVIGSSLGNNNNNNNNNNMSIDDEKNIVYLDQNQLVRKIQVDYSQISRIGFKVSQFSFARLSGADPITGVEMASTGEVACFGKNKYEAFSKAMIAAGFKWPKRKRILLSVGPISEKSEFLPFAKKLFENGYHLCGTSGTAEYYEKFGIKIKRVRWMCEAGKDDTLESENDQDPCISPSFLSSQVDLCIILPSNDCNRRPSYIMSNGYVARRLAVDLSIPLLTNIKVAKLLVDSLILLGCNFGSKDDTRISNFDCSYDSNRYVNLPGLYDVHVHLREPGGERKEDWVSGTSAALVGGITFVGAMPNTSPAIVDLNSYELVSNLAKSKAKCDYGIFVGASADNSKSLSQICSKYPVFALKMYLNETFSTLRLENLKTWIDHIENAPRDLPICIHSEGENAASIILLAHLHDRPVHICHVSLEEEILLIKKAKEKGIKVTCEVCPHHLFLNIEDDYERLKDGFHEVRPRLAKPKDVQALWENMDTIDIICTDHAPHEVEEKKSKNPPPGFPGLETIVPLMLTAVNQGRMTLKQLVDKMYNNPRRIFNLPAQVDTWIEVDLTQKWVVPSKMRYTKSQWTPYEGKELIGKVKRVILRGKIVMVDGKVLVEEGYGENLVEKRMESIQKIKSNNNITTTANSIANNAITSSSTTTNANVEKTISNDDSLNDLVGGIQDHPVFIKKSNIPLNENVQKSMNGLNYNYPSVKTPSIANGKNNIDNKSNSENDNENINNSCSILENTSSVYLNNKSPHRMSLERSPVKNSRLDYPRSPNNQKYNISKSSLDENPDFSYLNHSNQSYHQSSTNYISISKGSNIISTKSLTRASLRFIFNLASEFKILISRFNSLDLLKGKILGNIFYEPSTRTSSSFWAAMTKLGGSVLSFQESASSVAKGETLDDTIKTISSFCDVLVIRHPEVGAVQKASQISHLPVINAGDGIGEHPSQALLDVFTVREELGTVNSLHFTIVGDLKNGRTVHSLVQILSLYNDISITYISPESLKIPQEIWDFVASKGIQQDYSPVLHDSFVSNTDVLYVTRIQKERFTSIEEYNKIKGSYIITPSTLTHAKEKMIIMHPLPRVDEINTTIDSDPRAAYFRQVDNGLYIRMALLAIVLGKA